MLLLRIPTVENSSAHRRRFARCNGHPILWAMQPFSTPPYHRVDLRLRVLCTYVASSSCNLPTCPLRPAPWPARSRAAGYRGSRGAARRSGGGGSGGGRRRRRRVGSWGATLSLHPHPRGQRQHRHRRSPPLRLRAPRAAPQRWRWRRQLRRRRGLRGLAGGDRPLAGVAGPTTAAAARGCACCTRASSTPCSLSCGRPARRLLSSWSRWRASSTPGGRRNGRARSARRCTRRWRWRRRAALGRGAGGPHFRSASLPPGRSHRVLAAVSGLAAPAGPLERNAVGVSGARSGDGAQMPPGHRGRRSPRRAFNASLDGAAYSAAWAGGRCPAHRRCSASAVAASLQHWSASVKVGVRVAVRRG